jgi:tetratricopeptide (TPR) repeat protein
MLSPSSPSPDEVNAQAKQSMQHGIQLMEKGDPDSLLEAQSCFERAISLRETLPLEENPVFRWGLVAGWMNRGDALTRLGGLKRLNEALRCYDTAIAHVHRLPLDSHPMIRWRLTVAWINRGITEQAKADETAAEKALRCFDTALQVMRDQAENPRPDYQQVQAAAWMNRANALLLLSPAPWRDAAHAARQAVHHSRSQEKAGGIMAETGIKGRYVLCQALAHLLETPPVDADEAEVWILEATDAVEEVMNLTCMDAGYHALREAIFHFGCRIYRAFQPHFLAEFMNDSETTGGMSEGMRRAAQEALAQAAIQIRQENLAGYTPGRLDRLIQTLQSLSAAGKKIVPQPGGDNKDFPHSA